MRVLLVGGTGPIGRTAVPRLLREGHEVAVAHSGAHEPPELDVVEHLHGTRSELLAEDGAVVAWRPEVLVDTFPGGATPEKAQQLAVVARRCDAAQLIAVSSLDVYRHCALAGVDGHEAADLPSDAIPLREDAPRRSGPSPLGGTAHDNVAMEDALAGANRLTVLRPGAIYGPQLNIRVLREWFLVAKVVRGDHRLLLPAGGVQVFHRVALARVAEAVVASIDRAPEGRWACNVADPQDLTFGALAGLVGDQLDWSWELEDVVWSDGDHPWNVRHPVLVDTRRLEDVLGVREPDAAMATRAQIAWLWEHRDELMALDPEGRGS
jgi:nucleoside-diphosphate-sugar epimerase